MDWKRELDDLRAKSPSVFAFGSWSKHGRLHLVYWESTDATKELEKWCEQVDQDLDPVIMRENCIDFQGWVDIGTELEQPELIYQLREIPPIETLQKAFLSLINSDMRFDVADLFYDYC